jgi:hypothetical protein
MKKIKFFAYCLSLLIALNLIMTACKKEDEGPTPQLSFPGRYAITSAKTSSSNTDLLAALNTATQLASPCGGTTPPFTNPALIELKAGVNNKSGNVELTCTTTTGITPSNQGTWEYTTTGFTLGLKLGESPIAIPLNLSQVEIEYNASDNNKVNKIKGELPSSVTALIPGAPQSEGLKIEISRVP